MDKQKAIRPNFVSTINFSKPLFKDTQNVIEETTLAARVLARDHRETPVSGFSMSKNETELLFRAAKSNAFHLLQEPKTYLEHKEWKRTPKIKHVKKKHHKMNYMLLL